MSTHAAGPEAELIEGVKVCLDNFNPDWGGLDALPGIKCVPLPFWCRNYLAIEET